jgi:acetamidase/formamidase
MGDGELTGTAVEVDAAITLKIDRVPGFPTGGPVVETDRAHFTCGMGVNWEEALKIAWIDMVTLVCHLYDTTPEHANLLVGTLGDAVPGFVAFPLYSRGFRNDSIYVTCQIGLTKDLRRTSPPLK